MKSQLRTLADALAITSVAALGLAFASTTDWPRWAHVLTLLPASYLVSRLSDDTPVPVWKAIGSVCLLALPGFLQSGPAETRLISPRSTLPLIFIFYYGWPTLERFVANRKRTLLFN